MDLKTLKSESYPKESILVGILWSNPEAFDMFSDERLNRKTLGNNIWGFYLGLGRRLHNQNYETFDEFTVANEVAQLKLTEKYEKYGGYELIEELMFETKDLLENVEAYYDEVKKYALLREYHKLFGDKVLETADKYNYRELNRNQISAYWNDKLNNIDIEHNESSIEAYNLLDDIRAFIDELDINPDIGMPFYNANKLSETINGWAYGTLSILSAFSGNGKTSFMIEKLFMSCIYENEKLLVIANEMDLAQYRKMLLITVMGTEMYKQFKDLFTNPRFNRKSINKGNFTKEEKEKLYMACDWLEEKINGKNSLIKFVPLENYTMDNVQKVVKKFARRGYRRVVVDTAKPSEGGRNERWVQFVEDFDVLYKLARKDGGGLNLAMFCTVQQADNYVGKFWLNEMCIGDGRKIKNVCDLTWHMRPVYQSEYKDGQFELNIHNWKPLSEELFNQDENQDNADSVIIEGDGVKLIKNKVTLKEDRVYYLIFTSKNRRGMTNITGLDVLVYEADFNSNRWTEVGWATNVRRDDGM